VDGIYIVDPTLTALSVNNVERVEVLRGPQGTLCLMGGTGRLAADLALYGVRQRGGYGKFIRTPGQLPTARTRKWATRPKIVRHPGNAACLLDFNARYDHNLGLQREPDNGLLQEVYDIVNGVKFLIFSGSDRQYRDSVLVHKLFECRDFSHVAERGAGDTGIAGAQRTAAVTFECKL
jgi:hypothetical protein